MASAWYNKGKGVVMNGDIDLLTDTIKVMLVTSAYTFDADHDFANDVTGELTVSGYTGGFGGAGRKTLASKTVTIDNTNDRAYFDAADVSWTALGAGETIGGAILLKEVTNDAASPLIAFIDLANAATAGTDVSIIWSTEGILRLA